MKTRLFLFVILIAVVASSCSRPAPETPPATEELSFTVERAPEWTDIFKRTSGWFGGDGIFAIPYSGVEAQGDHAGDSILFLFSDTMFGEITGEKLQPGYVMVNNSVATTQGADPSTIKFQVAKDNKKKPATLFIPNTLATKAGDYYWLGDGFVNHALDSTLYIFGYRIRNTNDGTMFPFQVVGNSVIAISHNEKFPYKQQRQFDLPVIPQDTSAKEIDSFGAAVLVNTTEAGATQPDGYVYTYGIRGKDKQLIVSRVKAVDFEKFQAWEYWTGKDWGHDLKTLGHIADSVSNELSVTPLPNGKFGLIYQYAGIFPQIYLQVGDSPVGPFGPRREIWNTTNDINDPDLFTYNAKAHPAISKPGELLVSYNVNSFKFADVIEKKPDLYRPRFVKIIFAK